MRPKDLNGEEGIKGIKGLFARKIVYLLRLSLLLWMVCNASFLFAQQLFFQSDSDKAHFGKIIVTKPNHQTFEHPIKVYLKSEWEESGEDGVVILGKTSSQNQQLIFSPLLPFQHDQHYVAIYTTLPPVFFSPKINNTLTKTLNIYP